MPWSVVEAAQVARPGHQALDVEDGLADEQRRHSPQLGHRAFGRKGGHRFADAGETLVGLDFDQHDGGRAIDPAGPVVGLPEGECEGRCLDGGDLHWAVVRA